MCEFNFFSVCLVSFCSFQIFFFLFEFYSLLLGSVVCLFCLWVPSPLAWYFVALDSSLRFCLRKSFAGMTEGGYGFNFLCIWFFVGLFVIAEYFVALDTSSRANGGTNDGGRVRGFGF